MSYIIKFINNKFIVSSNTELLIFDYNKYYKELRDFLVNYKYIEIRMNNKSNSFFIKTKFGLKLYKCEYFTKMINTNNIEFYDIAKICYIFYINKIL